MNQSSVYRVLALVLALTAFAVLNGLTLADMVVIGVALFIMGIQLVALYSLAHYALRGIHNFVQFGTLSFS